MDDIYCLSEERNTATIERFLAHFCQRPALDPLTDTWLQVRPHEKYPAVPEVEFLVHSVAEVINYAVRNPTHGFNFYTQVALRPDIRCIIIQFTYDAKVVFGISIVGGGSRAFTIEDEIKQLTQAHKSFIATEYPPADDEEEFANDAAMWQGLRSYYAP